ncbi:MAG: mechanosensitive ion channel domain-containing protein [Patescibacteria group bacterium]
MTTSFADRIFELLAKSWDRLPQLLLTLVVGYFIIKLIKVFLRSLFGYSKANSALKGIILSVLDVALWIFLVAALLQQVGLTQISLALSGTVAISALALSAGSTAFVQDLVAGIFLAQDPDFNAGDRVKIEDIEGIVERMDARKIRLRDDKGILHIFPNSHFDRAAWMVLKKR